MNQSPVGDCILQVGVGDEAGLVETSVWIVEVPQHGGGTAQLGHCSLGV